jgi:hypothetical protein
MYRGEGMLSALVDDIFKGAEDFYLTSLLPKNATFVYILPSL